MKKKGFTLVELLVVIAIIAMLLAILMPALGKVRQLAYRMMCGTNLSGMGKAMMVYANDSEEEYPIAGRSAEWVNTGLSWDWDVASIDYTGDPDLTDATVTASMYLLIKYADVSAAQFNCQGGDQKKFELEKNLNTESNYTAEDVDITECWDFGDVISTKGPWDFCSYSYQMPYGNFAPTVSSPAGVALMADRSPFFDTTVNETELSEFLSISDDDELDDSTAMKKGNATGHQQEGQNVLFGDSHVSFEKRPNVGIEEDNIYNMWAAEADASGAEDYLKQIGDSDGPGVPITTDDDSQASDDSYLVTDLDDSSRPNY